jgi:hypothetical protein
VILIERSEIGGESRRQPAVTVRADSGRLEPDLPFVAVVDARFAGLSGPTAVPAPRAPTPTS